MANLVKSIGYALGKLHIGLISYLLDLYCEGNRKPLSQFMDSLGISFPLEPIHYREWNSVDLAILERTADGHENPAVIIELKVDDHETGITNEEYQTNRYANRWPNCPCFVFITLGKGEYYHPPRNTKFHWIRIRQFERALRAISDPDMIVLGWLEQVQREVLHQDLAIAGNRRCVPDYRTGNWNIYVLGSLADAIRKQIPNETFGIDITCGTYGSRPDTICHLDWFTDDLYLEINYNGLLNVKMSFGKDDTTDAKHCKVDNAIEHLKTLPFPIVPRYQRRGRIGNSKTVASFDVGLIDRNGFLECKDSIESVKESVISILRIAHNSGKGNL
ncbi:MAG TPA: hypothetical protein PLP29_19520 [Candidatus Ozemobacteraceae bacterium]|mgnify:CR=1 FL=1|nr:hypothetical protein [Candidatus Ozemobacteraceae bacterium]